MHWTHLVYGPYRDSMFDLDRFLADCRDALASIAPPAAVAALVERAMAVPAEVEAVLGAPRRGGLFTPAPLPGADGSQRGLVARHGDLSARAPDVGGDRALRRA